MLTKGRIMRKLPSLLCFLTTLIVYSTILSEAIDAKQKNMSETKTPTMQLVVLLGAYYTEYQAWPQDEKEFRQFAIQQGKILLMEKFEEINFVDDANDSLRVDYKLTAKALEDAPPEDRELYAVMAEGTLTVSPPDEKGNISAQTTHSYGNLSTSQDNLQR